MPLLEYFVGSGPWAGPRAGPWAWLVLGLALLVFELVLPGGWFLWLGAAGIATGLVAFLPFVAWPLQVAIFGVLALAAVVGWTAYMRGRPPAGDHPRLNRRAEAFLGREATLDEPIVDGFGRLALGDSIWRIAGPDLAAGRRVRVVGADGPLLKVEPGDAILAGEAENQRDG